MDSVCRLLDKCGTRFILYHESQGFAQQTNGYQVHKRAFKRLSVEDSSAVHTRIQLSCRVAKATQSIRWGLLSCQRRCILVLFTCRTPSGTRPDANTDDAHFNSIIISSGG
eukprot:2320998-Amphidinium_carterae.1